MHRLLMHMVWSRVLVHNVPKVCTCCSKTTILAKACCIQLFVLYAVDQNAVQMFDDYAGQACCASLLKSCKQSMSALELGIQARLVGTWPTISWNACKFLLLLCKQSPFSLGLSNVGRRVYMQSLCR